MKRFVRDVRVVVADDHEMVLDALRLRLEGLVGVRVVGEACGGREAIALIDRLEPAIALVDVRMPEVDGLEVVRVVHERNLATRVVLHSASVGDALVSRALALGAAGYIQKGAGADVIRAAIHAVSSGETFVDPELVSGPGHPGSTYTRRFPPPRM